MQTIEPTISMVEAISHAIRVLFANYFGKAPVDTDTFIHGDLVICRLHGTLTPGEARHAAEDPEVVAALRAALHAQLAPAAIDAVERITGEAVVSHMSTKDPRADEAIEVFVLASPPTRSSVPI